MYCLTSILVVPLTFPPFMILTYCVAFYHQPLLQIRKSISKVLSIAMTTPYPGPSGAPTPISNNNSHYRSAGREHIPIYPRGFIALRFVQLLLAILVIGLCGFGVHLLATNGACLSLFVVCLMMHPVEAQVCPELACQCSHVSQYRAQLPSSRRSGSSSPITPCPRSTTTGLSSHSTSSS